MQQEQVFPDVVHDVKTSIRLNGETYELVAAHRSGYEYTEVIGDLDNVSNYLSIMFSETSDPDGTVAKALKTLESGSVALYSKRYCVAAVLQDLGVTSEADIVASEDWVEADTSEAFKPRESTFTQAVDAAARRKGRDLAIKALLDAGQIDAAKTLLDA